MALELRIAGPGIDVSRRLEPGEPPLVLGRDAECSVCLPDPERNVSRRHLSVWNETDELYFHVLSVVNGVEMPFGEAPPGARGVLPHGQTLKIGEYRVSVDVATGADAPDPLESDPWSELDNIDTVRAEIPEPPADDPFGEWGFESTYGADGPAGRGLQASGLAVAADISAFYEGLGLDFSKVGALSQGELESMGRLVRTALFGFIELHKLVSGSKEDLRSEDRTMMAQKTDRNPLKEGELSEEMLLQYLFGGRANAGGFVGPERAIRELAGDLLAHEKASSVAARALADGILKEFDPDTLKERLLPGATRLFESARAWDAFVKDYGLQTETEGRWAQRMLAKYFTSAYVRENMRVKRDTANRQR